MARRAVALLALAAILGLALPTSGRAACRAGAPDVPLALVLTGGGAKGAWEAGVAAALVERRLPIRLVAGSSVGALHAAVIADGRLERLEGLWRTLRRDRVYRLRPSIALAGFLPGWLTLLALDRASALFDPRPLRELITDAVDLARVRESPVNLLVVATDLARGERRAFDNRTVTVDALMAATAVPGAFPPVLVNGAALVDGGLTGRAPVLDALETGVPAERVLVITGAAAAAPGEPPTTMRRVLEEAFETAMVHQIARDVELARLRYADVDVQVLAPSQPLALRPLDFDATRIAELLALGRADAAACVSVWEGASAR